MKIYKSFGLFVIVLVLSAFSSRAQLLNFGSSASVEASLADQELADVFTAANDGYINTWVVSDSSLDSQGLIFVYQVVNNGPDTIDTVALTGYGFVASDILPGGAYSGISGLSFGSTPSASGNTFTFQGQAGADTVAFESGDLAIGGTSDYLAVFTSINGYYTGYGIDEDGFSAEGAILAPVPEANTFVAGALILLPLGIGIVRTLHKDRDHTTRRLSSLDQSRFLPADLNVP